MPFSLQEKNGIIDLLQTETPNIPLLLQLAKHVTKNVTLVATEEEALDYIFTHITDCATLLNKKVITKEVLFKYLHKNKVTLTGADFSKALLIQKVIEYWHSEFDREPEQINTNEDNLHTSSTSLATKIIKDVSASTIEEFPIHLLARQFSEWFFANYNKDSLKLNDFWSDAKLLLRITANDGVDENTCDDSSTLLQSLIETRQRFGFFFNPNLTHSGVQGRMDVHGLVLVLTCGTLHTASDCVGVFECVFGLMRDPFSENNWKLKTLKLMLRSKGAPVMPSLEESDTFREALELPVPQGEIM